MLQEDFMFIDIDMDEEKISKTYKRTYKKKIKALINKAAFKYFMKLKEKHSKLDKITYTQLKLQPYLSTTNITNKHKQLLYLLRSHCYSAKLNF